MGYYDEFSCIDISLQRYSENEDYEKTIVKQIAAKHQNTSEDQETNEDNTTEHERVTNQNDRKFIAGLRLCFMQEGNAGGPISALETCADFVQLQPVKRTFRCSQSREHCRVPTLHQFLRCY
jgi:hypothetical protein